jgi:hypothetical protein
MKYIILLIALLIAGCAPQVEGVYEKVTNKNPYFGWKKLEFKSNNLLLINGGEFTSSYKVEGAKITMSAGIMTAYGEIQGDKIITDGEIFVKLDKANNKKTQSADFNSSANGGYKEKFEKYEAYYSYPLMHIIGMLKAYMDNYSELHYKFKSDVDSLVLRTKKYELSERKNMDRGYKSAFDDIAGVYVLDGKLKTNGRMNIGAASEEIDWKINQAKKQLQLINDFRIAFEKNDVTVMERLLKEDSEGAID